MQREANHTLEVGDPPDHPGLPTCSVTLAREPKAPAPSVRKKANESSGSCT